MAVAKLDVIEQYLDNSGLLLAGGLIYTYAGGTTTPLASYADATGLIANSNPVVLDSSGRADLWFTVGTSYKVIIKTSAGVTLHTVDAIVAPDVTAVTGSQFADIVVFYASGPPATIELLHAERVSRAISYSANFGGSYGFAITNPTASFVVSVRKNATSSSTGTAIGTITVATNGTYTFATTGGAVQSLAIGDKISFYGPTSADTTMANFGWTLAGTLA
jgi:hypothetical protein